MKVHNLVVTGSLQSGGENLTSISSSVVSTVVNVSSSVSTSIGQLSSSMASSMTSLSSSLTSSMGSLSSSMNTTMTNLSSSMVSVMATTGSNVFKGDQTISGSVIPAVNGSYDLGSPTNEFRHLYLSSASLYIDGTKVLGSTTQELQITTDAGQSFKILEAGSDTITLQAADGNITLATSGGGDVILDPTTGIIALKGTTTVYAGNKILSSDGNAIQFGNSVTMTGSLVVTGFIETQELRTTYISSSILYRSGSTKFGDELTDTHSFTGSLSVSGSISVPGSNLVSGSAQVLSGTGIWSGSAQLPSGVVSGSAQLPSGTVSGSAQITLSSTTGFGTYLNQAVLTSSSPTFAGLTNNGSYSQTTTSTQPVTIYGDSGDTNGLFRIQMDSVSDSFGTGARTFLGDGGIDIFLGTSNSSYTPGNTYIALNHSGEISMGAGSATKHFTIASGGTASFSSSLGVGYSSPAYQLQVLNTIGLRANSQNFQAIKGTGWGYSPGSYRVVMLGDSDPANFTTVSIGYDPSGNSNGAFNGGGSEVLFRNGASFATPTSANTAFHLNTLVMKDGKVGIAKADPAYTLDVNGDAKFVSNSSARVLYLKQNANNSGNIIQFQNASDSDIWEVVGRNNQFYIYNTAQSAMSIYINPTTNNVGIGSSGTDHRLDVNGNIRINQSVAYLYFTSTTTNRYIAYNGGDTYYRADGIHYFEKTSGFKGFWDANSNLTVNGTITESSALRYKEKIETLENSLDKILRLRGVSYIKKETGLKEFGLIAEEANEVAPELVLKNTEGEIESVAYGRVSSLLIEAIKELKKEIEELKQNK